MRSIMREIIGFIVISMICCGYLTAQAASHPDDIYWEDGFYPPDISYELRYMSVMGIYQGKLVLQSPLSGQFGSARSPGIAMWDGVTWYSLDTGIAGGPTAVGEYDGKLIVAHLVVGPGSSKQYFLSSWNGTAWEIISDGLDGQVREMVEYENRLVIVGDFTMIDSIEFNHIAAWDGTSFLPFGSGTDSVIYSVAVGDSALYIGGAFSLAGDVATGQVARWDGANWQSIGFTGTNSVYSIATYKHFVIADRLIWDGLRWSPFGSELGYTFWQIEGTDSLLYVSGTVRDSSANQAAFSCWDGATWTTVYTDRYSILLSMSVWDGKVVLGGDFAWWPSAMSVPFIIWDGNTWSTPHGRGLGGFGNESIVYDGQLVVSGGFLAAGDIRTHVVASWNGRIWTALTRQDTTLHTHDDFPPYGFAEYDGSLIACGNFYLQGLGGCDVHTVARWDGSQWVELGAPMMLYIVDVTIYNGELVAGGYIRVGNDSVSVVRAWDGSSWRSLAYGSKPVNKLAVYDGSLYAGGEFDSIGGVAASGIARYSEGSWQPVGSGLDPRGGYLAVNDLRVYQNKLIVGGYFNKAGGKESQNLAMWDGQEWSALGADFSGGGFVIELGSYDGNLIVGGRFDSLNGKLVNNVVAWDGATWSGLGSGVTEGYEKTPNYEEEAYVYGLTEFDGKLVVLGSFKYAGDKVSAGIAMWTKGTMTDIDGGEAGELPASYQLGQNYPNPFNPSTTIEYSVPVRSHVSIDIFNVLGQHVYTLVDSEVSAGEYEAIWAGQTASGAQAASGLYLYRLRSGDHVEARKMVLLK